MSYEIRLLGSPQAQSPTGLVSFRPDMRFQFLAFLAYKNDWVTRDALSYLFWSDVPTETARHNLRQLIKRLKVLSLPENLEIERERLRWQTSSDVADFKKALLEKNLSEGLEVYTGDFLEGLESGEANEFHTWLLNERETLRSKWREALLGYAQQAENIEAMKWLEKLLERDPLDEEVVQLLLSLLADTKQNSRAIAVYQSFAKRLGDELGLSPTSGTQNLFERIQTDQTQKSRVAVLEKTPSLVPSTHSNLIGREIELSDIAYLLTQPACQIITLTGPGGIGKTFLALQAMKDNAASFEQVGFVPLEAVASASGVALKIAEVLNLVLESSSSVLDQLTEVLKDKKVMLLLDNFEHLLDSATFVSELIAACSHLKILITSRERLNLKEEHLLVVSGLALPQTTHTLDEALATASLKLFFERAKRVQLHFEISSKDLPQAIHVCQRLGGIPLALELAAVWVRVMSLAEIDKELSKSLDLLESQSRNRLERHRSLRTVFNHAWNLLNTKEQEALKALSIFHGGFTREAASVITSLPRALMASLVDKSLLRLGDGRYDFHPLLHDYIAEQGLPSANIPKKHSRYYLYLLEDMEKSVRASAGSPFRTLELELPNSFVAWEWAIQQRQTEWLLAARAMLTTFFDETGRYQQGDSFYAETVAKLKEHDAHPRLLSYVLGDQAWCVYMFSDFVRASLLAQEALTLARFINDVSGIAKALNILGCVSTDVGQLEVAKSYYQEFLNIARKANDSNRLRIVLMNMAGLQADLGDYFQAEQAYQEALQLARADQDKFTEAGILNGLGTVFLETGRVNEAIEVHQQSRSLSKALGLETTEMYALRYLTQALMAAERLPEAKEVAQQGLLIAQKTGVKVEQQWLEDCLQSFPRFAYCEVTELS